MLEASFALILIVTPLGNKVNWSSLEIKRKKKQLLW